MKELKDYSGEFNPNVRMADFSKETLVKAWGAAAKLFIGADGMWITLLREKFGDKKAFELATEFWKRNYQWEVRRTREAMNIWGTDVAAVLKTLQVDPGAGGVFPDLTCELKDKNYGLVTIGDCLALRYWERHGDSVLQEHSCKLDVWAFDLYAKQFHPKMQMNCLKQPPRKNKDEIACQWEVKLVQ